MIPQLIILTSGETLVSYAEELDYEPKCHMISPYLVSGKTKVTLTKWPSHTDDEHILLKSDDLLTVCTANEKVTNLYTSKVKDPGLDKPSKSVMLSEDEQVPNFDEYEPKYIEE